MAQLLQDEQDEYDDDGRHYYGEDDASDVGEIPPFNPGGAFAAN